MLNILYQRSFSCLYIFSNCDNYREWNWFPDCFNYFSDLRNAVKIKIERFFSIILPWLILFFFYGNVQPQKCFHSPNDGRVQFHMKSAICHSYNTTPSPPSIHLYQILQLSNYILSQFLIWQKPTLPRSPVVLRPSDPVQARGRDTGRTWGREGSSHECPAGEQPMSDQVTQLTAAPWADQLGLEWDNTTPSPLPIHCSCMLSAMTSFTLAISTDLELVQKEPFCSSLLHSLMWTGAETWVQSQRMDKTISK